PTTRANAWVRPRPASPALRPETQEPRAWGLVSEAPPRTSLAAERRNLVGHWFRAAAPMLKRGPSAKSLRSPSPRPEDPTRANRSRFPLFRGRPEPTAALRWIVPSRARVV